MFSLRTLLYLSCPSPGLSFRTSLVFGQCFLHFRAPLCVVFDVHLSCIRIARVIRAGVNHDAKKGREDPRNLQNEREGGGSSECAEQPLCFLKVLTSFMGFQFSRFSIGKHGSPLSSTLGWKVCPVNLTCGANCRAFESGENGQGGTMRQQTSHHDLRHTSGGWNGYSAGKSRVTPSAAPSYAEPACDRKRMTTNSEPGA